MECHKCFDHCSCRPCSTVEEDAIDILKSVLDRDGFVLERAVACLESLVGKNNITWRHPRCNQQLCNWEISHPKRTIFMGGLTPLVSRDDQSCEGYLFLSEPNHTPRSPLWGHENQCLGCRVKPCEQWKEAAWLFRGFVGDEILPSYVGIIP